RCCRRCRDRRSVLSVHRSWLSSTPPHALEFQDREIGVDDRVEQLLLGLATEIATVGGRREGAVGLFPGLQAVERGGHDRHEAGVVLGGGGGGRGFHAHSHALGSQLFRATVPKPCPNRAHGHGYTEPCPVPIRP